MRSVKSIAILVSLFSAAVAQAAGPVFSDDFESGNGKWYANDGGDIVITSDSATCSTSYDHETVSFSGGRVLSNVDIPVVGGNQYCLSAFIRVSSDSTAYVGYVTTAADSSTTGDWPIGDAGSAVVVAADDMWHWYGATVTLDPSAVSLAVMFELAGSGYADFDDFAVTAGPCGATYAGVDQHQVCGNDSPVCGSDGACGPAVIPPADMGGGPSSTPDMGGAISSSFPGGNTTLTPTTPVAAAEGTPLGTGPVKSESGEYGCSMGGSEGQRSFGLMMLAFVVVMLAGRRRRA